jgi:hypothetical protein
MQLHEWMSDALCKKRNNIFWYPPLEAKVPEQYYSVGRELCHRCPVWQDCLDAGIDERWGMWGGLTPLERTVFSSVKPSASAHKPHGSWIRYRQGCQCRSCLEAHEKQHENINMNAIPFWEEPVEDLEMIHFNLLSSKD